MPVAETENSTTKVFKVSHGAAVFISCVNFKGFFGGGKEAIFEMSAKPKHSIQLHFKKGIR